MHMEWAHESGLEQSRSEKIRTLGFLCYNLYVDGILCAPEMGETVKIIKQNLDQLFALRRSNSGEDEQERQNTRLNDKLTELGCICYNLYIDGSLINNELLSLCDSITELSREITEAKNPKQQASATDQDLEVNKVRESSELKITCPYGMEPIPVNFKQCMCGYRNRSDARYCAKCGSKLYA